MKIELFGPYKTGHLVPIKTGRGDSDWAFVPSPPPEQLPLTEELWTLVANARAAVANLNGLAGVLPNPTLLLRPLQRREALRSSSLEGTYVTPKEMLLFELENKGKEEGDRRDEWREVFNYYRALRQGYVRLKKDDGIRPDLILQLHKILMAGTRGQEKSPGQLRTTQVYVGSDRRYNPPPPEEVAACMGAFQAFLDNDKIPFDPLIRAFVAHYQFEAIHPFADGNGRIGRLMLSLYIYRWLDLSLPWLYLSEYFENHRREYIEKMFRISTDGEWLDWLVFCLRGTIEEADAAASRCKQLNALKRDYKRRIGHTSSRMNSIIDRLFATPVVKVTDIQTAFKVSYPTARADVEKLKEAGCLAEMPDVHPRTFLAAEIMRIAYGE
jgi:Fic family protein